MNAVTESDSSFRFPALLFVELGTVLAKLANAMETAAP